MSENILIKIIKPSAEELIVAAISPTSLSKMTAMNLLNAMLQPAVIRRPIVISPFCLPIQPQWNR